jgi:Domain of unknown function (DUF4115)
VAVLIEGIVAAVVVLALAVVLLTRRRSHDDVHSVEGYHRSLHTLEHINARPGLPAQEGSAYPESAVRVGGTPSVRVTDRAWGAVPPVAPPPVSDPDVPVPFDDTDHSVGAPPPRVVAHRDKAMSSMNHRPRRLAAPAMAVAAVIVLVIVLLVTGAHKVAPPRHHHGPSADSKVVAPASRPTTTTTTTTTAPAPAVSPPQSGTPSAATYEVSGSEFTLAISATSGSCWVDATSTASGSTLFTGTLQPGDRQAVVATGPLTLVVGAPTALAASVDGTPVTLPPGFHTPFTMHFVTAAAAAAS